MMRERYRLKQDGIPIAWAEGPAALQEITHYARVYGQDGPVLIEQHIKGKWKAVARRRGPKGESPVANGDAPTTIRKDLHGDG